MCELLVYLLRDHDDQRALLRQLATPRSSTSRRELLARLRFTMVGHGLAETQVFYPVVNLVSRQGFRLTITRAHQDHTQIEQALDRLHLIHPAEDAWVEGMVLLKAMVDAHLREEELALLDMTEPLLPFANQLALMASMDRIKTTYGSPAW